MPDSLCSRSSEFPSLSCSCSRQSTSEILQSSEMEREEGGTCFKIMEGRKEERNRGSRGEDVESEGGGGGGREERKAKRLEEL